MSGVLRAAHAEDVARVWPAVKASHLAANADELLAFRDACPWRLRVTDAGESVMLERWREHLDVLAIRGLWAASHRTAELVEQVVDVARAQGFSAVLSPLVVVDRLTPYLDAGMTVRERIVAVQGLAADVTGAEVPGMGVREATASDLHALAGVDADCFDEFWRYGVPELARAMTRERLAVATDATGAPIGYATCAVHGATATLGRLAVAPHARGRGVARELCAESARWASRRGAFVLTLCTQETNAASRSLYRALGLHEAPESYALASMPIGPK